MVPKLQIPSQDFPVLVRALQSLERAPDSWFGPIDDPALIPEMKNAARGLPAKLKFHPLQLSDFDLLALQQACAYQCLTASLSKREANILESYENQFFVLLSAGNPNMLR